MPANNPFAPYKLVAQSDSSLRLQASSSIKAMRFVFLLMPVLMLAVAVVLYSTEKDTRFLYILGGVAILEFVAFSFIKLPADVQLDRMGFTLQRVSLRGTTQTDYLWADVDRIRQRIQPTKYGKSLGYEAMLNSGKRVRFLTFGTYDPKTKSADDISAVLRQISHKEIEVKA